jgi:hypothetical protein
MLANSLFFVLLLSSSISESQSEYVYRNDLNLTTVSPNIPHNATLIDLSWNNISYIGPNTFVNFSDLITLLLRHNQLIGAGLDPDSLFAHARQVVRKFVQLRGKVKILRIRTRITITDAKDWSLNDRRTTCYQNPSASLSIF